MLYRLYEYAERHGIDVDCVSMNRAASLSVMLEDSSCAIAIDPWQLTSVVDETTHLAHELGHCVTGSFYNPHTPFDVRQKHENRADKWAILQLIPENELEQAIAEGYIELWQLAEYFDVTEELARKAICWYQNNNLAD